MRTVQRLSKDAKQAVLFRGRMESVDKWMSQRKLPHRLRSRIANYYAEVTSLPRAVPGHSCESAWQP